jgi:lysophospholipase L1-like esterase
MRRVLTLLVVAGCLAMAGCASAGSGAPGARHQPPASYYLALGDSLSQGVQPNPRGASVSTPAGYPDQLYTMLHRSRPGLQLVKLGCAGETTGTMIHGGICRYGGGSQLAAAVAFLHAHRGHMSLITLDIGANDPGSCMTRPSVAQLASCVARFIPQATGNLATIVRKLHQASPETRIIAMNYYLPALGAWRHGLGGRLLARASELITDGYNHLLTRVYQANGVRVADVFSAFHTASFSPQVSVPGFGSLPRNVAAICQWTWECAAGPRGPNIHPNRTGYQVIARAFLQAGALSRR